MSNYPSIFNDVIGPVMRGPSSSHCAASLRIARICLDLMGGQIKDILIEFDPNGSLATTHKGQGSDMGLFGGFLGWDADDERLPESEKHLSKAGINYAIQITELANKHPNTYKISLTNDTEYTSAPLTKEMQLSSINDFLDAIGADAIGASENAACNCVVPEELLDKQKQEE